MPMIMPRDPERNPGRSTGPCRLRRPGAGGRAALPVRSSCAGHPAPASSSTCTGP